MKAVERRQRDEKKAAMELNKKSLQDSTIRIHIEVQTFLCVNMTSHDKQCQGA